MDTCVVTVFHNPTNCEKNIKAFNQFYEYIKSINFEDHLYVCELSTKKLSQFNDIKNLFFIQIKNNLCYKECAINFLLSNIPKYKKIIIADYEIKVNHKNWIDEVSRALENYGMVQAFNKINVLEEESKTISLPCAVGVTDKSKKIKNNYFFGANTGYIAEYLYYMNGLFDKCVLGWGDVINTMPFLCNKYTKLNFLKTVCKDTRLEILDYIDKAQLFIKQNKIKHCSLNLEANHLSYREKNKSLFKAINQNNFSEIFYENKNKFYEPLDERIEKSYLKSLNDKNKNTQEIILFDYRKRKTACKAGAIVWLADNNTMIFKNIKKVKLYFKKEKELSYFRIISDWQELKTEFLKNECCIQIDRPKSIIILSDYYIPKDLLEGEDTRKLSAYLYKVEVFKNKNYEEYPIKEITIE